MYMYMQSYDPMKDYQKKKIHDRHDEYHMRQMRHMIISPARPDPFLEGQSPNQKNICSLKY